MYVFEYEELEEATKNFSPSQLIAKGSHGSVFKGSLKDGRFVAIKKQSLGLQKLQDNSKMENEVNILSSLPPSPYLIKFQGTSHDCANKSKVLVMEHMPNGTLHDLLHEAPNPPTWPKRAQIAIQVAKAIQILHEANPLIVHRDIKSSNILFDSGWVPRLADFGLAVRLGDHRVDSLSRPAGTIGYLDPHYTSPCKLSTKSDVFSFGVVLLEIVSCTKAIDVSRVPASIVEWALPLIEEQRIEEIRDRRVVLPMYMENAIRRILCIAARCVSSDEHQRPSAGELVMELENCSVERVRFPVWISIFSSVLKKKRKIVSNRRNDSLATTTTTIIHVEDEANGPDHVEFAKGKMLLRVPPQKKMLLREVLAEAQ